MSRVNFKIVYNDGREKSYLREACYANLLSKDLTKIKEVVCFELPEDVNYTTEKINEWIKYVNSWGFPCEYIGLLKRTVGEGENADDNTYHQFVVRIKDYDDKRVFGSALMLIRYLFEWGEIRTFPNKFFNAMKTLKDEDPFLVMQFTHSLLSGCCNSNHMLRNTLLQSFITMEEFKKRLKLKVPLTGTRGNITDLWQGYLLKKNSDQIMKNFNRAKDDSIRIYVVGGDTSYAAWIPSAKIVDNLNEADLALFTGGADVDPSLYGQPRGKYTTTNIERDLYEKEIFNECRKNNIPMLGICRGSQFLCVMAGGKLIQHQENPKYIHNITTHYGDISITSTHHQSAYLRGLSRWVDYDLIGWTSPCLSKVHLDGNNNNIASIDKEAEIVKYPRINALGIQGHPEHTSFLHDEKYAQSLQTLRNILRQFLNR